jgi:DNA-binding Xre family transcriptional regulator
MRLNILKLERERERRKMKMAQFSRLFKLSDSAYKKMIASQSTTFKTLAKIADTLKVNPLDLLLR